MAITLNGDSGITNVNGTAAAPAITGTDTDSGMYFGTNTVALSTSGTAAVTVDASQNVGIGTASPTYQLHISGTAPRIEMTDTDTGASSYVSASSATGALVLAADENNVSSGSAMAFRVDAAERMRITANGGLAFAGASNYGTSGQVLQSNGDAAPTWVAAPSPTTANVLAATAGAAAGDIGTYAFLGQTSLTTTTYTVGSNYSGLGFGAARSTTLANGSLVNQSTLSAASGTWKCMGNDGNVGSATRLTVFLRIA